MAWSANSAPWTGPSSQQQSSMPSSAEDSVQVRPMGLKVHYTFDQANCLPCLARWKDTLNIQCMPLDHQTLIGVIDLQICLQAITQGSPELINQPDCDYSIYAIDFSEPETPMVGQGMLSWALLSGSQKQLVTGRVTTNKFSLFGKGPRETLEVTFKLKCLPKRHQPSPVHPPQQPSQTSRLHEHSGINDGNLSMIAKPSSTPSEAAEWSALMQSSNSFSHSRSGSQVPSPNISSAVPYSQQPHQQRQEQQQQHHRRDNSQPPTYQPSSIPLRSSQPQLASHPPSDTQLPALAPAGEIPRSRPSSRNSTRPSKPRGRPRKKVMVHEGNTSGYEDGTEAEDGPPKKKRATITKVGKGGNGAFGAQSESLRGVAIASGSLRNFRPAAGGPPDSVSGSHLQEVPRVPTPVPMRRVEPRLEAQPPSLGNFRRQSSTLSQEARPAIPSAQSDSAATPNPQDPRSPTESLSLNPSPAKSYTPAESPADFTSSPPVPRSTYAPIAPSSPVLPPMPQQDSGFMSGGIEGNPEETELPKLGHTQDDPPSAPPQKPKVASKTRTIKKVKTSPSSVSVSAPATQSASNNPLAPLAVSVPHAEANMVIVQPGPTTLLPQKMLYNPPSHTKKRIEATEAAAHQTNSRMHAPSISPAKSLHDFAQSPNPCETASQDKSEPQEAKQKSKPVINHSNSSTHSYIMSAEELGAIFTGQSQLAATPVFESIEVSLDTHHNLFGEDPFLASSSLSHGLAPSLSKPPTPRSMSKSIANEQNCENAKEQDNEMAKEDDGSEKKKFNLEKTKETRSLSKPRSSSRKSMTREPSEPANGRRSALSRSSTLPPIPASDPVLPPMLNLPDLPVPPCAQTDAPQPRSIPSKNYAKKRSIRDRLIEAVQRGELPTFCANCGAIETPTWRKMFSNEQQGEPPSIELSSQPGSVVSIDILEVDTDGEPVRYRLVKKSLGEEDNKEEWHDMILCNPCGIYVIKHRRQRPSDKWVKDESRLGQERKRRQTGAPKEAVKSKKTRTKSDPQALNSEASILTDPLVPTELNPPRDDASTQAELQHSALQAAVDSQKDISHSQPGSSHSRKSVTGRSPVPDQGLGSTRRLLFPSPRKDGEKKILTNVSVNVVHTERPSPKQLEHSSKTTTTVTGKSDDTECLFGLTPSRPSRLTTPPLDSHSQTGPFKTPTRPTPSHRPITRSVSRSIRSGATAVLSPLHSGPQTPTPTKRRTPRNYQALPQHHNASHHSHNLAELGVEDTPFTRSLNQLLSEAHSFTADSPAVHNLHPEFDLDSHLPILPHGSSRQDHTQPHDGEGEYDHVHSGLHPSLQDFGQFLSTDAIMPSSPPLTRHQAQLSKMHQEQDQQQQIKLGEVLYTLNDDDQESGLQSGK